MIDVTNVAQLPAGDSCQQLSCRLGAVALKSPAQRQKAIARFSEFSTPVKSAAASRGGHVLPEIDTKHSTAAQRGDLAKIERDVQVPAAAADDQFGFLDRAALHMASLKRSDADGDALATTHGEDRHAIAVEPIGTRIQMHRGIAPKPHRLPVAAVGSMRFENLRHGGHRVARQLRAELRKPFPNAVVGQVVQPNAVDCSVLKRERSGRVAGPRKGCLQRRQRVTLAGRGQQSNRNRSLHKQHATALLCHMPGTVPTFWQRKEQRFLPDRKAEVSALNVE